jgi:hypothetical protein
MPVTKNDRYFKSILTNSSNTYELIALSKEQVIDIAIEKKRGSPLYRKNLSEKINFVKTLYGYKPALSDVDTLARLISQIGIKTKGYQVTKNGVQYYIFKGFPMVRDAFKGTKYSTQNKNIVSYMIGSTGIKSSIKSGARFAMIGFVAFDILNAILADTPFISTIVGTVASDLGKVVLASLVGYGTGVIVLGSGVTAVSTPIIAVILIAVGTAFILDEIDKHYKLTDKLIYAISTIEEKITKSTKETTRELSKSFNMNFNRFVRDMEFCIINNSFIHYR